MKRIQPLHTLLFFVALLSTSGSMAANKTVNLAVDYKTVNFTGMPAQALAVNDQIPSPTLHFTEGDHVTINVTNHLKTGTTIHWHGLILPWQMDGVAQVSQKPIKPGDTFHYQFTLKQAGTYWYHAHKGLQEQQGVYGGITIDPLHPAIKSSKDFMVILSDWNDTDPETVYANLKKEGDYYSKTMPLQPSLWRFWKSYHAAPSKKDKQQLMSAYLGMQKMRMSIYDISDIKYDTFLLNGHPPSAPWTAQVKVGDTVRLRFVGAGASTFFKVKIPHHPLKVVQVDGQNVKPYTVDKLTIAPGETYDVLISIIQEKPTIIYTESADKVGVALGALLTEKNQTVDYQAVAPFPDPAPVSMMNHGMMVGMSDEQDRGINKTASMMDHNNHQQHQGHMPAMPKISSSTQYDPLVSPTKTNDPSISVQVINIDLTGYMDRYMWFLNGLPESEATPIIIQPGKRYRIVFTNKTMMHHPMHIHGHWFILRNGHGAYDPKLHTIDIPPGATVVADFDADASGQWIFHCHNLFHMKAGMSNIIRYQDSTTVAEDKTNVHAHHGTTTVPQSTQTNYLPGHKHVDWYANQEIDISGDLPHQIYQAGLATLIGYDDNKLQLNMEDAEINQGTVEQANLDVFAWHLIDQFWAVKGGVNYTYRPAGTPYFQPGVGIEGLMPYFIQTDVRSYYHSGSAKLDLSLARDTQLTNRFYLRTKAEGIFATKTIDNDEIGSGLNSLEWTVRPYYQLTNNLSVYWQYQYTHDYSSLRRLQESEGEATSESTYSIGFDWLL